MSPAAEQSDGGRALPARIGERYRVDGLLGLGGMAAVYRVFDLQQQRALALKCVLVEEFAADHARFSEMLAREYRTLAQLSHPSVISVYEYGLSSNGPYYTMELLDGSDLHQLSPVPWRTVCAYLRDVASCLALLHSRKLVHRDVSPRNIRCQGDRAKLLDFGALTQMGMAKHIVGTPPLMAPEALHRQPLDGRCDLYSLGATLYWALTRRHAYPARTIAELRTVWQQRPAPPSASAPEVPEPLDTLVMSLLSHEPEARPRSAAEVMERLSQIAGLAADESLHVSQSYLATPSLQGRDAELADVRRALADLKDGRSRCMWIEGEAGVGRSRLLAAILLEARLAGVDVLNVSASDVLPGELALARELLERALEVMPRFGESAGSRAVLAASDGERGVPERARARLVARVSALVRRACSDGPLVVTVDDVDTADPASQALIAGLLRSSRRRLLLSVTTLPNRPLDPALSPHRLDAEPIVLRALDAPQTEELLSSVFGDVPGVPAVAARVHELSRGNPRATMELAEHLVATGKARYALGGWELPRELPRADLPGAWITALDARLLGLPPDARELAESIAFSFEYGLSVRGLDALSSHGDAERRQLALDALLTAGLVRLEGEHARFVRVADRERVGALTDASRARDVHARLAKLLVARRADAIAVARCWLRANDANAAIDTLLAELSKASRSDTAPADYASVLQQAMAAVPVLGRPRAERFILLRELLNVGDHLGVAGIPACFAELFAQLRSDSGLQDYEALPSVLDPLERLQQAYATAQARYDALPEHERVLPPLEAIQALGMTARQAAAFAAVALDYDLMESMPSLAPFTPLSDMLRTTVAHTLPASAHLLAGRYEQARSDYRVVLERVLQPDHGGLDTEFWQWAVNALRFALGHLDAGLGTADALRYADELERAEGWVISAWEVRRAYHLRQGDWREAESCRDRIERLRVQSPRRPPMVDMSAGLEFDTSAHANDLLGVRRAVDRLQELIQLHPGYGLYAHYGPAVCEHLRGNLGSALEHIDRALAMVVPGRHPSWPWMASRRIEILLGLGRNADAMQAGTRYLQQAKEAGLQVMADHITLPLGLAEAKLGDFASAVARIDAAIRYREELGGSGLNLGWAYEARARVAIWMRDQDAFVRAATACAREYGRGRGGSSFASKYEALRSEARQAGLISASELPPTVGAAAVSTYMSTFASSTAHEERIALSLDLLVSESGAVSGALYRLRRGRRARRSATPERIVSTFGGEIPEHASALLSATHTPELDGSDDDVTRSFTPLEPNPRPEFVGPWRHVELVYVVDGRVERTGSALLCFEPGAVVKTLAPELIEMVARLLEE